MRRVLTRLLHSHKTWRGDYAVRFCVLALGLAFALALYFPSLLNRRAVIAQTGIVAAVDTSLKKGAVALVISGSRQPFLITDRNLANNNCNGG
jgi:hypothetical protein